VITDLKPISQYEAEQTRELASKAQLEDLINEGDAVTEEWKWVINS
jgi:hypothetical protein